MRQGSSLRNPSFLEERSEKERSAFAGAPSSHEVKAKHCVRYLVLGTFMRFAFAIFTYMCGLCGLRVFGASILPRCRSVVIVATRRRN